MSKLRYFHIGEVLEEMESQRDIKGDIIPTHNVGRGIESSHHTQYTVLADSRARPLSTSELNQLRADIERQLSHWHEVSKKFMLLVE